MAQLKAVPGLLASEEGQRVVREYNKLATVLVSALPAYGGTFACKCMRIYICVLLSC